MTHNLEIRSDHTRIVTALAGTRMTKRDWLDLDEAMSASLVAAARDLSPVTGLTHNHYKYPARFSPKFVRTAIAAFTEPGDLVFDPFVGGGTTLVEALASQRDAVGVDISSLAIFVSEAKTLLLDETELDSLRRWVARLPEAINIHKATLHFADYEEQGYYRNINTREFWRLRKAIEQALASALRLRSQKAQVLARCIILRAAQWTLDTRKDALPVREFRRILAETAVSMIAGATEFNLHASAGGSRRPPNVTCINASAAGVEDADQLADMKCPKLVLTSPPYPGVHVLYHRWQVNGGRETPAPFWIANKLDGSGLSYYTLGDRKHPELSTYFDNLRAALRSAVNLSGPDTVFVQVVAFNSPDWQLPRYLEIAEEAGLTELFIPNTGSRDHRLWRTVPNRRWYADQRGSTNSSREAVLFHRLARSHISRSLRPSQIVPPPLR